MVLVCCALRCRIPIDRPSQQTPYGYISILCNGQLSRFLGIVNNGHRIWVQRRSALGGARVVVIIIDH